MQTSEKVINGVSWKYIEKNEFVYIHIPKGHPLERKNYEDPIPLSNKNKEECLLLKTLFSTFQIEDYQPIYSYFGVYIAYTGFAFWERFKVEVVESKEVKRFLKLKRTFRTCLEMETYYKVGNPTLSKISKLKYKIRLELLKKFPIQYEDITTLNWEYTDGFYASSNQDWYIGIEKKDFDSFIEELNNWTLFYFNNI